MKANMAKNQKTNRMVLDKLSTNIGFKKINVGYTKEQEEVAAFTANTVRKPIDTSVFIKSKEEKKLIKEVKKDCAPFENERFAIILV